MSTAGRSGTDPSPLPDTSAFRIGIVVSEWNREITEALFTGARATLNDNGIPDDRIIRIDVPGSFELIAGARSIVEHEKVNAVICLGCLIQGETRHFEFIAQAVANGLAMLSIRFSMPFVFGVLTTDTPDQARERAGGSHGHKGEEAALTAIRMAGLKEQFPRGKQIGFS
jgi:6,7-dimethyl-8-ribityllumazine synthase